MAIVAFAGTGGAFSCRQVVGIGDNPPTDLTTSACGLPWATSDCASCVQASCCAESSACEAYPDCSSYERCLSACAGDRQCRSQCTVDSRLTTGSSVSTMSACLAGHCASACGLTCGSIGEYLAPPASAASCQGCLVANLCDNASACASSAECDAYVRCIVACPTIDCNEACSTSHAAGYALYGPIELARTNECASACSYGDNWTCVGHVKWPQPKVPTGTIDVLSLYERGTTNLVADATVSACGPVPMDPSCSMPLVKATTDAKGNATLMNYPIMLPNTLNRSGWVGFSRIDAPGYPPNFEYSGFPLTEARLVAGPPFIQSLFVANDSSPPGTGVVWVVARDCLFSLAGGVTITTNGGAEPGGLSGPGSYSPEAGTTGVGSAAPGIAEYSSLPAGYYTFTATPITLGKPSSNVGAWVADGGVTLVNLVPTP